MRSGEWRAKTQRISICDVELRFRATTGGRVAIWEVAPTQDSKTSGKADRQH